MRLRLRRGRNLRRVCTAVFLSVAAGHAALSAEESAVIVDNHRFGPERVDSMTVMTAHFRDQIRTLMDDGFTFTSLNQLGTNFRRGSGTA